MALLKRISTTHHKREVIESDYARRIVGYRGEQTSDYYLSLLPEKDFNIFHDIRLKLGEHYFQIDSLLVAKTFALIIETKNIAGTLFFDDKFNQLIRTKGEVEEGFADPLAQAELQRARLKIWLTQNGVKDFPIEFVVVNTNSSTVLKAASENNRVLERVLHVQHLVNKIKQYQQHYNHALLSSAAIKRLSEKILQAHTPQTVDITKTFSIPKEDIIRGVFCPSCKSIPMKRNFGVWFCPKCQFKSKDAHVDAVNDYFLLMKDSITNKEFREFLLVDSRKTATYLLNKMNLYVKGVNKRTIYYPRK